MQSFSVAQQRILHYNGKMNDHFPEEDPRMNERTAALQTVALGIAAMFAVYWVYSLQIAPRLPIGEFAKSLTALLCLYGLGLGLYLLIIKGLPNSEIVPGRAPFSAVAVCFLLQFTALMAMSILVNVISMATGRDMNTEIDALQPVNLFLLLIFNPVVEEFVFRKLFAKKLLRHGQRFFMLASSFCFAIVHSVSLGLPQVLYTFLLGLIWSYLYVRTGKLWIPIVLHALSNLFGGVLPSLMQNCSEAALGVYSMGMMLLAVAGLVCFFVFKKRIALDTEHRIFKGEEIKAVLGNPGVLLYVALTVGMYVLKNTMI